MYVSGRHLKRPNGCSAELYQLMLQCWTLDPHRRKKTQEALRDINHLLYQGQLKQITLILFFRK